MNQLLPIIRRVRRPLLTVDAPPPVVAHVEPVQLSAELEARKAEPEVVKSVELPKADDAEASS